MLPELYPLSFYLCDRSCCIICYKIEKFGKVPLLREKICCYMYSVQMILKFYMYINLGWCIHESLKNPLSLLCTLVSFFCKQRSKRFQNRLVWYSDFRSDLWNLSAIKGGFIWDMTKTSVFKTEEQNPLYHMVVNLCMMQQNLDKIFFLLSGYTRYVLLPVSVELEKNIFLHAILGGVLISLKWCTH